ncbi:MAG: phosphoenolpyruvate--protein phosphotransferase [marine benthic group bacterium]|nr:phosphoenolpyruvate--protein phosphotransferase [Gemmatimonadota bacterium]MCL7963118.1 phosphoenolpyruvate--protein phosphotransferase [Candidatus Carthagonibacter metallireducens]MCL7967064.1 phosphoenolpyruvate--protein phosphotransferase [Gemmatimonadota bacterium]MCL7986074.1 phosphoenolpyruvate--protein phosphotransferase [Gemmatimonadota bacterium]
MSLLLEGVGASPGRALGPVRHISWEIPSIPHTSIATAEVDREIERFHRARAEALSRLVELQHETTELLGGFEGKVFESQAWMIEDPDLVAGTEAYIRENLLSAERAFEMQLLEQRVQMMESVHAMVMDRLADLRDVRGNVLSCLLGHPAPGLEMSDDEEPSIVVAHDIAPSVAVRMRPDRVLGMITAAGTRGSHSVLIARSLGIPAVVDVGPQLARIADGCELLVDGKSGRLIVDPTPAEIESHNRALAQLQVRRKILAELAAKPTETVDGVHTVVQANLDQPFEIDEAIRLGAEGVGLLRTEFLVIGHREIPSEEEQFDAYRSVVEAFPGREVTIRTFDIGGDKYPQFMSMKQEDNPYLGWRAIRVCLDEPELFQNQLRAAVRAADHGNVRLLVPLVTSADELIRTREHLESTYGALGKEPGSGGVPVGLMVETPAAVETLDLLAPYVDFVSLGTNDLTQYVLAADRGNPKVAELYDPLHPALIRLYARVVEACEHHHLDLSVCGELSADPIGVAVLLGLGYRKFSVSLSSLAEIRELIRHLSVSDLVALCAGNARCESGEDVRGIVQEYLDRTGALKVGGTVLEG